MMPLTFKPIDLYSQYPTGNSIWRDGDKIERAQLIAQGNIGYMTHSVAKQWSQDVAAEAAALARIAGPNLHAEKLKQLAAHCEKLTRAQELTSPWKMLAFAIATSVVVWAHGSFHLGLSVFGLIMVPTLGRSFKAEKNQRDSTVAILVLSSELNRVHPSERLFSVEAPTPAFRPYWSSQAVIDRQRQWACYNAPLLSY